MNLKTARTEIVSARDHALQGLAYYQQRVESLNRLLAQVESIDDLSALKSLAKNHPAAKRMASDVVGGNGKRSQELPSTGGDFFPSLINTEKQTVKQLLDAAIARLGVKLNKDQVSLLRGRLTAFLYASVKDSNTGVQDEGAGRQRVFFRQ